jgi:hypothetical protein
MQVFYLITRGEPELTCIPIARLDPPGLAALYFLELKMDKCFLDEQQKNHWISLTEEINMKNLTERKKDKFNYYQLWLKSDCPKPWNYKNKYLYNLAKKRHIKLNHNISDYLRQRFYCLNLIGQAELADYYRDYPNFYSGFPKVKETLKNPPQGLRTGRR